MQDNPRKLEEIGKQSKPQFVMLLDIFQIVGAMGIAVLGGGPTGAGNPRPKNDHNAPRRMGDVCLQRLDGRRFSHVVRLGASKQMSRSGKLRSLAKSAVTWSTVLDKQVMDAVPGRW